MTTPLFRVLKGDPTAEELAALTVVLLATTPAAPPVPEPRRPTWWETRGYAVPTAWSR
ncbi:acyl-CoA carboxylase subunit epsilon [Actinosynnema sp. CA-299493]